MKIVLLALVLSAVTLVSACSALQSVGDAIAADDFRAELAVVYATEKVIDGDQERAQKIVDLVTEGRRYVTSETSVTVEFLDTEVRERVNWDRLDAADKLLVDAVLVQARQRLERELGEGVLTDGGKVKIVTVFDWIERTATPYTT